jgi:HSP20 family protein
MTEEPSGLVGGMGSHAASAFASGSPIGLGGTDEPLLWSPRVKVAEQGDEFVVTATLPCVSRDEVTVEIEGAELVLRSARRSGHQTEGHGAIGLQSEDGVFYCAIPLPDRANPSSARASMDNGVLTITLHAPPPRRRGRRVLIEGA